MKRLLFVGIIFLLARSAWGVVDLTEIGKGARPLALGSALAAGYDDATALFTNPAALTLNPNLDLISMNGKMLGDVNYVMAGGANEFPIGSLGLGYINASVGGIPLTTVTGSGSTAAVVQTGMTDYSSSILSLTYATKLSRIFRGKGDNLSFGATLKYFSQGFAGGGAAMQDAVGTGMDADLGLLWKAAYWSDLGLTVNNFLPVGLGGKFVWQKNSETESIPMVIRAGGRFKLIGSSGLRQNLEQELTLLLDYEHQGEAGRPNTWHAGLEYWPVDLFAFRLGVDQRPSGSENGVGVDNNLTGGVGINFNGFTFDYAFHKFGDVGDNATHFFSVGFRGGEPAKARHFEGTNNVNRSIPTPTVVPKPFLTTYIDLPPNYWAGKPIEYLATLGIMGGYPDRTFRPESPISRGELAAILGLNNISRPADKVSRAEAAVMFARYSRLYVKSAVTNKPFPDVAKSDWAAPAIAACRDAGYFEYLAGQNFKPNQALTRAEAAETLSKTPKIKAQIKKLISGE